MAMNKKLFNRIKKLNDEGLDTTTTIKLFITMAKNPEDAAEAIDECFFEPMRVKIGYLTIFEQIVKEKEEEIDDSYTK